MEKNLKQTWRVIGEFVGLVAIITLVFTILQLTESNQASDAQDAAQATQLILLQQQLDIQREMATLQANQSESNPAATIVAKRLQDLEITAVALATQAASLSTLAPVPDRTTLVQEDFEDGTAQGISYIKGNWNTKIVDANGLLEVQSASTGGAGTLPLIGFGSEQWTNYVLSFRFNVTECDPTGFFGCAVIVTFRNESDQAYVLIINTNTGEVRLEFGSRSGWIAINKGITDVNIDLPLQTWHDVLLAADRNTISASVDGNQTTTVSDDRLKTGSVGIIVGASTTAEFDDINAWSIP